MLSPWLAQREMEKVGYVVEGKSLVAWARGDHQVAWSAAWAQWNRWGTSALHSTRRHHQVVSTYPRHLVVWLAGRAPGHWGEGRATARALKGYWKASVAAYSRIRGDRTAIARATERDGDGACERC